MPCPAVPCRGVPCPAVPCRAGPIFNGCAPKGSRIPLRPRVARRGLALPCDGVLPAQRGWLADWMAGHRTATMTRLAAASPCSSSSSWSSSSSAEFHFQRARMTKASRHPTVPGCLSGSGRKETASARPAPPRAEADSGAAGQDCRISLTKARSGPVRTLFAAPRCSSLPRWRRDDIGQPRPARVETKRREPEPLPE